MSMESQVSRSTAAPLARRVAADADAGQIADAIVAAWQEIDAVLAPIIGQRGIAGLYKRSVHLTSVTYPWLAGTYESVQTAIDPVALKSVFVQQSSANAAAGGAALLQMFYVLLTTLVGPALTEQLLRPVWTNSLGGPAAQDTSL